MLTAKLGGLSEDFLDLSVISLVPVNLGLHHQDRDVQVKSGIVLLQGCGN